MIFLVLAAGSVAYAIPIAPRAVVKGGGRTLLQNLLRRASFAEEWSRYPAPDVLLNDLRTRFPHADLAKVYDQCSRLTPDNRTLLGDNNPVTGAPTIDNPNAAFVNWYVQCLVIYIEEDLGALGREVISLDQASEFIPLATLKACAAKPLARGVDLKSNAMRPGAFYCYWQDLPEKVRRETVRELALRFVGPPEVWVDLELAASPEEFIARIVDEINDFAAKGDGRYDFVKKYSDLVHVTDAVRIISLLINLQNSIKY